MLLDVYDSHDLSRSCVVAADSVFMFLKTTFYIGRYAGIERTVLALKHVDKIHIAILAPRRPEDGARSGP